MRVCNTSIIQFDLVKLTATIQLTPLKQITINSDTKFAHAYATGWGGYTVWMPGESIWISARVMRQIAKYLKFIKQDFDYDLYHMPIETFYK